GTAVLTPMATTTKTTHIRIARHGCSALHRAARTVTAVRAIGLPFGCVRGGCSPRYEPSGDRPRGQSHCNPSRGGASPTPTLYRRVPHALLPCKHGISARCAAYNPCRVRSYHARRDAYVSRRTSRRVSGRDTRGCHAR